MIDEKGRLFGKVNLIDLFVLLVLLAVAAVLVFQIVGGFGGDAADADPSATPTRKITPSVIEYTAMINMMEPGEYEQIKAWFDAGDTRFMTNGGLEVEGSEVIDLWAEPFMNTIVDGDGVPHLEPNPYYLDVYFTARSVTSDTMLNRVNTQEVRIGRSFIIKTRHYEVVGVVIACDTVEELPAKEDAPGGNGND